MKKLGWTIQKETHALCDQLKYSNNLHLSSILHITPYRYYIDGIQFFWIIIQLSLVIAEQVKAPIVWRTNIPRINRKREKLRPDRGRQHLVPCKYRHVSPRQTRKRERWIERNKDRSCNNLSRLNERGGREQETKQYKEGSCNASRGQRDSCREKMALCSYYTRTYQKAGVIS